MKGKLWSIVVSVNIRSSSLVNFDLGSQAVFFIECPKVEHMQKSWLNRTYNYPIKYCTLWAWALPSLEITKFAIQTNFSNNSFCTAHLVPTVNLHWTRTVTLLVHCHPINDASQSCKAPLSGMVTNLLYPTDLHVGRWNWNIWHSYISMAWYEMHSIIPVIKSDFLRLPVELTPMNSHHPLIYGLEFSVLDTHSTVLKYFRIWDSQKFPSLLKAEIWGHSWND